MVRHLQLPAEAFGQHSLIPLVFCKSVAAGQLSASIDLVRVWQHLVLERESYLPQ
jgi:hypothetical protein